jgi:tight adherence protein C
MPVPVAYYPFITAALVFLFVILLAWGWMQYSRNKEQRQQLFDKIRYTGHLASAESDESTALKQSSKSKMTDFLSMIGKQATFDKVMNPMDRRVRFLHAGLRGETAPPVFHGIKVLLAVMLPVFFFLANSVFLYAPPTSTKMMIILTLTALAAFYMPDLWLYNRGLQRKEAVLDSFPDALDLLVVCVEAGMGLDAAMNRVSREILVDCPVLSEELTIFSLEMRGGMQRRDALKNLSLRTDLVEVNRLTTLLIQTDKFGTSVGSALKVFSDTLRTQRYQRAEELAGKIPVKLLFPMILFIFPSLFLVIMGPAAIRIYHTLLK